MSISFSRKLSLAWNLFKNSKVQDFVENELELLLKRGKDELDAESKVLQSKANNLVREIVAFTSALGATEDQVRYAIQVAARLHSGLLLSAITEEGDEWVGHRDGSKFCARAPRVVIADGQAYDNEGMAMVYPDGHHDFKRIPVKLPYWPQTHPIQVDSAGIPIQEQQDSAQAEIPNPVL